MIISQINIYPIKSLRGITLNSALVEGRGIEHDRRWMLVDGAGKFLTQREFPKMATINVTVEPQGLLIQPGQEEPLSIPFGQPAEEAIRVKIWSSSVKAFAYPNDINMIFADYLGTDCRLVRMAESSKRLVNPYYAVRRFRDEVSFADGYPFLLANDASLADLNLRLKEPVGMERFRPNFVVSGAGAWEEDKWKKIRIGNRLFHVVKPCGRCVITTIDQNKGVKTGAEPLKTLASFRTKRNKVLFAQNLIADEPGGTVRVGDTVEVL